MSDNHTEPKDEKKLNNARIKCFGGYVPVHDIECVDVKQGIYKAKQIVEPEQRQELMPCIVFHRNYQPEINDLDIIFVEITLDDTWLGVPITLIPKEKLLFGYLPSPKHGIMLPGPKTVKMPRRQ